VEVPWQGDLEKGEKGASSSNSSANLQIDADGATDTDSEVQHVQGSAKDLVSPTGTGLG
jgi:hypothetical protein